MDGDSAPDERITDEVEYPTAEKDQDECTEERVDGDEPCREERLIGYERVSEDDQYPEEHSQHQSPRLLPCPFVETAIVESENGKDEQPERNDGKRGAREITGVDSGDERTRIQPDPDEVRKRKCRKYCDGISYQKDKAVGLSITVSHSRISGFAQALTNGISIALEVLLRAE